MDVEFVDLTPSDSVDLELMGAHQVQMVHEPVSLTPSDSVDFELMGAHQVQMVHEPVDYVSDGGGSAPVVHYQMIARQSSDRSWISWPVTGSPDSSGAQAPHPVIPDTIMYVRSWFS